MSCNQVNIISVLILRFFVHAGRLIAVDDRAVESLKAALRAIIYYVFNPQPFEPRLEGLDNAKRNLTHERGGEIVSPPNNKSRMRMCNYRVIYAYAFDVALAEHCVTRRRQSLM